MHEVNRLFASVHWNQFTTARHFISSLPLLVHAAMACDVRVQEATAQFPSCLMFWPWFVSFRLHDLQGRLDSEAIVSVSVVLGFRACWTRAGLRHRPGAQSSRVCFRLCFPTRAGPRCVRSEGKPWPWRRRPRRAGTRRFDCSSWCIAHMLHMRQCAYEAKSPGRSKSQVANPTRQVAGGGCLLGAQAPSTHIDACKALKCL